MARVYPIGICNECNNESPIMARGLCKRCYSRLWARRKSGGGSREEYFSRLTKEKESRSFGICKVCGQEGKIQSLEQCPRCYKKTVGRIIKCRNCGNERKHEARGLCSPCYVNTVTAKAKRKKVICSICKKERIHKAKGLCRQCYGRIHKKEWGGRVVTCSACGQQREHMAKGLCSNCYWHSVNGVKYNHRRAARKQDLPATLTDDQWQDILEQYNHSCAYCGKKDDPLCQEHWMPLSKGGGYTADNIVPACKTCNSRKHTMTGDEFLAVLEQEKIWLETSK